MKKLFAGLVVITLAGCSSIASQRDLAQTNQWMQIGKMDGSTGYHMKSEPELARLGNVTSDAIALYQTGYRNGIEDYCEPKKAKMRGLNGKPYKGQCVGTVSENMAVKNWLAGYDQYKLDQQFADINRFGDE